LSGAGTDASSPRPAGRGSGPASGTRGSGTARGMSIQAPPVRCSNTGPTRHDAGAIQRNLHAVQPSGPTAALRPPLLLVLPEGAGGPVRERHAVRMAPAVAGTPAGAGRIRRAVADPALPGAGRRRPH